MQRLPVLTQRARYFRQGFGFEALCRAFFEVSLHDGPEGYGGLRAPLGLLKLRIVAEVHRGERALRPLARFVCIERLNGPERHAALLRPDAVLDDPSSLAAISQPDAETRHGADQQEQAQWNEKIDKELSAYGIKK